ILREFQIQQVYMILRYVLMLATGFMVCMGCKTRSAAQEAEIKQYPVAEQKKEEDAFIRDQFIVQLKKGIPPRTVEQAFEPYGLVKKNAISPALNMWVFTYDQKQLDSDKMLKLLKESESVVQAEFDKKLDTRSRN
ncbi:MAG: hypothetical protein AAFV07_19675, partial [Bacteroidota bacterium]